MSNGHMIVQSCSHYKEKGRRRYTSWMTVLDGCHRKHYWTPDVDTVHSGVTATVLQSVVNKIVVKRLYPGLES